MRLPGPLAFALVLLGSACSSGDDTMRDPGDAGRTPPMDSGPGGVDSGPVMGTDAGPMADAGPMPPRMLAPCETATCWDASAPLDRCGMASVDENYMTASYNVHSYATTFHAGTTTRVSVRRTAGMFPPAILLTDTAGTTLSDGERGLDEGGVTTTVEASGRGADEAVVRVATDADVSGTVHVTGWTVVDEGFASFLGTDVTYELRIASECP
jgi:hypothetical protein